jgi:hypothetical protein
MESSNNYTEILKANRQDIIDYATDAIAYTNYTVAQVMKFIMDNEVMYNDLVSKKVMFPFSKMAQNAVKSLPIDLKVTDFTERVEAEMKARAKNSSSQFN